MREYHIPTKKEIDEVFGNADFGGMEKEDVVKQGLLKCVSGYYQGHTSTCIIRELGLITKKYTITQKGKYCLWEYFHAEVTV